MRYSFSPFGCGFGFGVWRTRYHWQDIWTIAFFCCSIYIGIDRNHKDTP